MAKLNILHFPDERLRTIAAPVESVTPEIQQIISDMFETMYDAPGIGLAATQVDIHLQIIVIDTSDGNNQPLCLINPEMIEHDGLQEMDEGCLSVPDIYDTVQRASHIKVKALNRDGKPIELEVTDLLAVCIQHEMDHLAGKLFVDYLSPLKQQRIKKKLTKQQKQATTL